MSESDTIDLIRDHVSRSPRPAFMCSFGKDSMVLAELLRRAFPSGLNGQHFPQVHGFPVDVIYHRDPWFPHKHEFADRVIRSWSMTVYDFLPAMAGIKVKPDMLELVSRYNLGVSGIDIPKNTLPPDPRKDYICGLYDWVLRPKSFALPYPWDTVILGHKSSDTDPFEGAVPLKDYTTRQAGVKLLFPLRDWTDDDVWNYIRDNHIPYDRSRYGDNSGKLPEAAWNSNDYTHACTACIDPRITDKSVFCPKLKRQVENVSHRVARLEADPDYIMRVPIQIDDEPLKEKIRAIGKV